MSRREGIAANENALALVAAEEKVREDQSRADLKRVMGSPEGRRFVWSLIEDASTFGPSFAGEALATAYNEGRRARGLDLLFRVQREVPDLYVKALQEALQAKRITKDTNDAATARVEIEKD